MLISSISDPHSLLIVLPPILEFIFANLLAVFDPPYAFPNALAHDAYAFRPERLNLLIQYRYSLIHLVLAQLARVFGRPRDDIGMSKCVEMR